MMNMAKESEKGEPEVKKSALVFTMFYVLGTLSHVPQSFYITANDYWMYKFRNPDEATANATNNTGTKTELQAKFTSYYTVASNISMVTGLVITVFLIKKFTPQGRIITTLSLLLALLIVTILFAWIDTDSWQTEFFVISLLIGVLLNSVGACFLLSIFHLAMKFPAVYLGAVLSGQSICGIMSALIQIATLGMGTSSLTNATIYFVIGALSVAVVEVIFIMVLTRQKYYQEQVHKEVKTDPIKIDRSTIFLITKKISVILVTMVLAAGMMVITHPGITSLVESTDKGYGRWGDVFFVPVCTFFLFNTVDFIGRECSFRVKWTCQKKSKGDKGTSPEENSFIPSNTTNSEHERQPSESAKSRPKVTNNWVLLIIAVLRLSLIPAILFCNVQPRKHLPVIFGEDWEYVIVLALLAFSSGYVMNLCIVGMPSIVTSEEMKIASVLIVLVMVVSLAICSVFGPILISLV